MCTCGAVLQIGGGVSETSQYREDPELLAQIVEMRARCVVDRAAIRRLNVKLETLKRKAAARNITPAQDSHQIIRTRRNARKLGKCRSASAFAMSSSTGGGLGAPSSNLLRKVPERNDYGRKTSTSLPTPGELDRIDD